MKHLALILSIPLLLVTDANAAPVVFIVRHAEKASTGGKDPDLSVQGQKRADALAHFLRDSQITSVFVTEFKRMQETAASEKFFLLLDPDPDGKSRLHIERRKPN